MQQVSFVNSRYSFCNVINKSFILCKQTDKDDRVVILSLDAQAFDKIEWLYLIATLYKFGFADTFIKWFKMLLSTSKSPFFNK